MCYPAKARCSCLCSVTQPHALGAHVDLIPCQLQQLEKVFPYCRNTWRHYGPKTFKEKNIYPISLCLERDIANCHHYQSHNFIQAQCEPKPGGLLVGSSCHVFSSRDCSDRCGLHYTPNCKRAQFSSRLFSFHTLFSHMYQKLLLNFNG